MPSETAPYLAGLRLTGRRVVAVGAGRVLARRLETLLAAGPDLQVVSPQAHPAVADAAAAERLRWHARPYDPSDLDGAWYVLAGTDDPAVNASVVAECERRATFCVRADDGALGSAVTPATLAEGDVQVAVLGGGDFRRSRGVRDAVAQALRARASWPAER